MNKTMNPAMMAITALYPTSIVTMRSALVFYGYLEKKDDDLLDLSFVRGTQRKTDGLIRVWTLPSHLHEIGAIWIERDHFPFFLYDIPSLCAIYLLRREAIGKEAFLEAMTVFRKMIIQKRVQPSEIQNRIYLYPHALALLGDFNRFVLSLA